MDGADRLPEPTLGPELAHIKARYQPEFKEALEQALVTLSSQHRNVLRLQVVGGLSGEQIASLYRVTRSTVSRWLSAARSEVLAETQRLLQQRLRLSPAEFHSLAGVVQSQLDLSLSRVLTSEQDE
jgi:RNA polymerase sigma-70 factor